MAPRVEFVDYQAIDCIAEDGSIELCDAEIEQAKQAAGKEDRVLPISVRPKSTVALRKQNIPSSVKLTVDIVLPSGKLHDEYSLFVDDCIEEIIVDDRSVFSEMLPVCPYPNAITLDLGPYLSTPSSRLSFKLLNKGGGFRFDITPRTDIFAFASVPILLGLVCFCFSSYLLWQTTGGSSRTKGLIMMLFCLGLILRGSYFLATEKHEREYDYIQHLEYLELVATKADFPALNECFMCRHPPMYYWLQSSWLKYSTLVTAEAFPQNASQLFAELHAASFVLSALTLVLLLHSAWVLMADEPKSSTFLLMLLLAVFPGMILATGRINNDILAYPLLFAAWAALWRWWQIGTLRSLLGFLFLLCLGMSIKKLSLVLLPIALILVVLRRGQSQVQRLLQFTSICFFTGLSYLVIFYTRAVLVNSPGTRLVGLSSPTSLSHFTTFDLRRVIGTVFNLPMDSTSHREIFWEYFYRTIFFGEFTFASGIEWLARTLLISGLVLFVFLLRGLYRSYHLGRIYRELPILGVLLLPLIVLIALRIHTTAISIQDFRYIPLFALGSSYYVIQGAKGTLLGPACIITAAGLNILFILSIS